MRGARTLSDKELLFLITEGYRQKEIAKMYNYSDGTISNRLRGLREKHGARTDAQLIAKLYHIGYFIPRVAGINGGE